MTSTTIRFQRRALSIAALVLLGWFSAATAATTTSPVDDIDAWVARLEGTWAGSDNLTPIGPIAFAFVFDREADGSLHAHTASSRTTWIDLRFHAAPDGAWLLTEGGALEGLGEQWHTLRLQSSAGDTLVWVDTEAAELLRCRFAVTPEHFWMQVLLRGSEHVRFHLQRLHGDAERDVRQQLAAATERATGGVPSPAPQASGDAVPAAVAVARAAAAAAPDDAGRQLALARAILPALHAAPGMQQAAYASEMVGALQRAVALDPELPEAHYALAQYHLNAPSIAGGSLDASAADAERLAALGSPLAEVVRAQIEARRGDVAAARQRLERVLAATPDLDAARTALAQMPAGE